jgi:N-acetylglutamate synthase-like GNAT family acetyltransferase
MKTIPTKTSYLEMLSRPVEDPPGCDDGSRRIRRLPAPDVDVYRGLYNGVGALYHWVDRIMMPDDELTSILQDPRVEVYVLEVNGQTAGFAELDRRIAQQVELAYFGLFPQFIGQGHGRFFLAQIIRRAWTKTTRRVWVHTCDLDHAAALPAYCQAGFRIYQEKTIQQAVFDSSSQSGDVVTFDKDRKA